MTAPWGKTLDAIGKDELRVSVSANEVMLRVSSARGSTTVGLTAHQVSELCRTLEEAAGKVRGN